MWSCSRFKSLFSYFPFFIAVFLFCVSASAQQILWVPTIDETSTMERRIVEHLFVDVLENIEDGSHIVGIEGLEQLMESGGFELPECMQGLSVCETPLQALFHALGVDLVIYVTAPDDGHVLHVTVYDTTTERQSMLLVEDRDLRAAVYRTIAELVGASGRIIAISDPSGATVVLDGSVVGTTPFNSTLTIGDYSLLIELEGYDSFQAEIDLRAGDELFFEPELLQRYGQVIIRTGTNDATLLLDSHLELTAFEPYSLEPGFHTLVVSAEGHNTVRERFEVDRGSETILNINLELSSHELLRRRRERLRSFPVLLESSLAFAGATSTLSGYHDGSATTIRCDIREDETCADGSSLSLWGLQLNARYGWRIAEFLVVGIGLERLVAQRPNTFSIVENDDTIMLNPGRRTTFRFLQPGIRYLYQASAEFYGQSGFALSWDHFPGYLEQTPITIKQNSLIWEFHAGGRYHINSLIYGFAQMDLAFDLLSRHLGSRAGIQLGVGFNFNDPLRITPWLENRFSNVPDPQPQPRPTLTSEEL